MKKYKKQIILSIILVVVAFSCFFGLTYAKYVYDSIKNYYLQSKGFYISSDFLNQTTTKNVDSLWDGTSVHFNLKNNLNESVITEYDIEYTVSCTIEGDASSYTECHLNGTNSSTDTGVLTSIQNCINDTGDGTNVSSYTKSECEIGGYNWENQISTKDLYFDVVLTNQSYEISDVDVLVTLTTTSPYSETLTGDFKLSKTTNEENNLTTDYKNNDDGGLLVITNSYSEEKCVELTWNSSNLILDENASDFSSFTSDTNGYINGIKFNIGAKKSVGYNFYGTDFNEEHTSSEFTLTETTGC